MVRGCKAVLTALILFAGCSVAFAQEARLGAGKVEIGGFPGGGTLFRGGDDNLEANFNVYTIGGGVTYYMSPMVAVEGEMTGSIGFAQDFLYKNKNVTAGQMPHVWTYMGDIQLFPGGTAGKRLVPYVTGGAGMIVLGPRVPTTQLGYVVNQTPRQSFPSENVGAGLKIFRAADAPNWGFRIDFRYLIVQKNSNAPAFFAQSKTRSAMRIYM